MIAAAPFCMTNELQDSRLSTNEANDRTVPATLAHQNPAPFRSSYETRAWRTSPKLAAGSSVRAVVTFSASVAHRRDLDGQSWGGKVRHSLVVWRGMRFAVSAAR